MCVQDTRHKKNSFKLYFFIITNIITISFNIDGDDLYAESHHQAVSRQLTTDKILTDIKNVIQIPSSEHKQRRYFSYLTTVDSNNYILEPGPFLINTLSQQKYFCPYFKYV